MPRQVALLALVLIGVIGWLDFFTSPDIRFLILYLIAIVGVAWWGSGRDAIAIAVIAAIVATFADVPWRSESGLFALSWNSFSRFVIFTAAAALVNQIREDREQLDALNREHRRAYGREALLARTDALTALPNFRAFVEAIQRESARAVREGSHLCVLYVDLDDFKSINDRYGHATGDTVLQDVAQALQSSVRGGDVVARIGGDEFIILLWHAAQPDAEQVAERIAGRIREIATAYPLSHLGASVGIRLFDEPPANPDDVVRLADAAMYDEKERRKKLARLERSAEH